VIERNEGADACRATHAKAATAERGFETLAELAPQPPEASEPRTGGAKLLV
jgi:hypothetical protein